MYDDSLPIAYGAGGPMGAVSHHLITVEVLQVRRDLTTSYVAHLEETRHNRGIDGYVRLVAEAPTAIEALQRLISTASQVLGGDAHEYLFQAVGQCLERLQPEKEN